MDEEFSSDEAVFDILQSILACRRQFLDIRLQRLITSEQRVGLMNRYMLTDAAMMELANRVYNSHTRARNAAATLLATFTVPAGGSNFFDSVPVVPTNEQIQACLESVVAPPNTSCAICQELVSSDSVRIRQCGHFYHRSCVLNWFGISVRCPVCRHDVRQRESPVAQTSTAEEQTSTRD